MEDFLEIDGKEYIILEKIEYKRNTYYYVLSTDGSNNYSVLVETNIDDNSYLKSVKDEKIIREILSIYSKK